MADTDVPSICVMICSTIADLVQYREEASRIIKRVAAEKEKRVQLVEMSMEKEVQSGERELPVAVSKRWVDESDWVVVIVGWNYGTSTKEPGANGLSVTEWEYRRAVEQNKRIFVFLAGSPGTAKQYRVSDEEKNDLKDWIPVQSREQQEKLQRFREELGKCHADMFANLRMFRERLKTTLENAIDDLRLDIQPGSPLAELIISVTPAIRDFIRKVTLIATCKHAHDCLHEIHQQVICRLQEEVLPRWRQEGTLSTSMQNSLMGRIVHLSEQRGALKQLAHAIPPDRSELCRSIANVLDKSKLWDINSEVKPEVDEFAEKLDELAIAIRHAFWEADQNMVREEQALDDVYDVLREQISDAQRQHQLSPPDDRKLNARLRKVRAMTLRLARTLQTHHAWQEAHDAMVELDAFQETARFRTELKGFCETSLPTLIELVEKELTPMSTETTTAVAGPHVLQSAIAGHKKLPSARVASGCHDLAGSLGRLLKKLKLLCELKEERAFDAVYRPFEDAFYSIDKRTMDEVERANKLVLDVQAWLDKLARAQRKAR